MSMVNAKNGGYRIVEPVKGWQPLNFKMWGDDAFQIEEWFDAGESLEFDKNDWEVKIEEPDKWERALQWVRSLAVATGLKIS
jgi:hypothetical protein